MNSRVQLPAQLIDAYFIELYWQWWLFNNAACMGQECDICFVSSITFQTVLYFISPIKLTCWILFCCKTIGHTVCHKFVPSFKWRYHCKCYFIQKLLSWLQIGNNCTLVSCALSMVSNLGLLWTLTQLKPEGGIGELNWLWHSVIID